MFGMFGGCSSLVSSFSQRDCLLSLAHKCFSVLKIRKKEKNRKKNVFFFLLIGVQFFQNSLFHGTLHQATYLKKTLQFVALVFV